jgi:3-phosphoglycerate kinase
MELEEPWRMRDILDHTLIKKATTEIRYCIEHLANRTFILGNLGDKSGKIKLENSLKIVYNVL